MRRARTTASFSVPRRSHARHARQVLSGLALAGALASSREVLAADGRTSSLSWLRMPGSDSCIATQVLARNVEERLGRRVFVSAAEADVSVEGRIEKRSTAGAEWHAVITVRDGSGALLGTRELDGADPSCTAMNDQLAFVIAVMIDPEAKLTKKASPSPVAVSTDAKANDAAPVASFGAPSSAVPPADVAPRPRDKEPWRFQADVGATVSSGLAPTIAPGASVAGILFPPGLPLGFRGYASLFLPTTADQDGARASFDLLYVGGALCPTLRGRAALAMVCFGGQMGALRAHADTAGRGIEEKTELIWNAVTEARVSIPLGAPIAVTLGVGAVLPLLRPAFEHSPNALGRDNIHKVSSFGLTGELGVGLFFP